MRRAFDSATRRFQWSLFRGRCRRNLLGGLVMLVIAVGYGAWAGNRFRTRGADATAFDQPIVRAAAGMVTVPPHLHTVQPRNDREVYLATVVSDQHDVMVALVVILLRLIVALTIGGLGLVLTTAGATEWEIRSELAPRGD